MDRGRLRGLLGFRLELQSDIRVIVIEPSAVATELTTHITHPDSKRAAHETTADTLIAPKDIAEVIAFAVSRPCTWRSTRYRAPHRTSALTPRRLG
jgi:NADP-dependent 3-hydroxy acid dehydrogenase YdfG